MAKKKYAKVTVKRYRLDDLEDAPYNSRTITQEALKGLTNSLDEFGLLALPVVNEREEGPRIVGGHQRIKVLREREEKYVHCIVVKFDDTLERRANFTLNNRALQGEFIPELTKEILDKIRARTGDGKTSLYGRLNFDKLLKKISRNLGTTGNGSRVDLAEGRMDEDDEPPLKKTRAISKHGTFYRLGNHTIHCGALQGSGSLLGFPVDHANMAFTRIAEKKTIHQDFLDAHLGHMLENTDGAIYIVTDTVSMAQVQRRFIDLHGHWSTTLIWQHPEAKPLAKEAYRVATTPVLYGWSEGGPHAFFGETRISNLQTLLRAPKSDVPVEIATKTMLLSSEEGETVLDVDVGGGASIIAAEKTGRRLIGYARTAHACDRARKRWAEFVGGKGCKWTASTPPVE